MAIKPKDVYDGRKKKRSLSTIIILIFIGLITLTFLLFYGLRSRCVYDDEGNAHIVFPFTQEAKELKEERKNQPEEPQPELTPPDISISGTASSGTAAEETGTSAETVPPTD